MSETKEVSVQKIPILKLTKSERLWLNELLILLEQNKKFDFKQICARLDGKISNDFRPLAMNHRLADSSGERLRLLGIVALQKNYGILKECNKVILSIKGILKNDPLIESIETQTISELAGLSVFKTSLILSVINEYGRFWRGFTTDTDNPTITAIQVTGEDHIFYQYRGFRRIQDLIIEDLKREIADKKRLGSPGQRTLATSNNRLTSNRIYVNHDRLIELRALRRQDFDFTVLIRLCEELNDNYSRGNYLATIMIARTILNHVPPLFAFNTFEQVANNYGGKDEHKSFKKNMQHLHHSLKNIADNYLHSKIRKKEILPNETQVDFRQNLDLLLGEIVRISI